jgi:hypothetical protein
MCNDKIIRRFAGAFILLSLAAGWWLSPLWLLFTAFVGLNLLQSSFTEVCPLERILGRVRRLPAAFGLICRHPERSEGPARESRSLASVGVKTSLTT